MKKKAKKKEFLKQRRIRELYIYLHLDVVDCQIPSNCLLPWYVPALYQNSQVLFLLIFVLYDKYAKMNGACKIFFPFTFLHTT